MEFSFTHRGSRNVEMAGSRLALLRGSFMTVLLIMALSFRAGISQDGDEDVTGRNVTRMRLLSYFPCTTARSPDECDVFAYAAAVLAVEEVNGFISSDSWPGRELEFELLPVSEAVSAWAIIILLYFYWAYIYIRVSVLCQAEVSCGVSSPLLP